MNCPPMLSQKIECHIVADEKNTHAHISSIAFRDVNSIRSFWSNQPFVSVPNSCSNHLRQKPQITGRVITPQIWLTIVNKEYYTSNIANESLKPGVTIKPLLTNVRSHISPQTSLPPVICSIKPSRNSTTLINSVYPVSVSVCSTSCSHQNFKRHSADKRKAFSSSNATSNPSDSDKYQKHNRTYRAC
jgi:hypothetical protein